MCVFFLEHNLKPELHITYYVTCRCLRMLKLKVVHLYGYSSAFPHTRTRTSCIFARGTERVGLPLTLLSS